MLGIGAEVQRHAGVVANLKADLSIWLVIVKVPVEVRQRLISEFTDAHAVLEDHALGSLLVHAGFQSLSGLNPDYINLHLVFSNGATHVEVIAFA